MGIIAELLMTCSIPGVAGHFIPEWLGVSLCRSWCQCIMSSVCMCAPAGVAVCERGVEVAPVGAEVVSAWANNIMALPQICTRAAVAVSQLQEWHLLIWSSLTVWGPNASSVVGKTVPPEWPFAKNNQGLSGITKQHCVTLWGRHDKMLKYLCR